MDVKGLVREFLFGPEKSQTDKTKADFLTLYEKLYFNEIEMREKLYARSQLPLAVLVVLVGLVIYVFKNMSLNQYDTLSLIFFTFFLAALVALVFAVYCFVRSWHGYKYKFLPSTSELEAYRKKIYNLYSPYPERETWVSETMQDTLIEYYTDYTAVNEVNNEKRSAYLYKTSKYLIIAFCCSVVAMPCFYFSPCNGNKDNFRKIEIVNPQWLRGEPMPTKEKPAPPPPPPGRVIKEGDPTRKAPPPPKKDK